MTQLREKCDVFVESMQYVADFLWPHDMYIVSLTCKGCWQSKTVQDACLQQAVARCTERVVRVRRSLFRVYTKYGTHCFSLNILSPKKPHAIHEPSRFQSFERTMYKFRKVRAFLENGSPSTVSMCSLHALTFAMSGLYIRSLVVRENGIRFVLVLTREGMPELTLEMATNIKEPACVGTHHVW